MLKSIEINPYSNGYNINQINCIDLPIAGAAGYYNFENYYLYCFYFTFFRNWFYYQDENIMHLRNYILEKLGLQLKPNPITKGSQLMGFIKQKIDHQIPVILIVKYQYIFYANQYLERDNHSRHALLVSDYDTQRRVLAVREFIHVRQSLSSLFKGDLFSRLQLKQEMLIDIWKKSNRDFKRAHLSESNTVYSMERIGAPKIKNYDDLIQDIIENYGFKQSKLFDVLPMITPEMPAAKVDSFTKSLTRTFYGPMAIVFDGLEKILYSLTDDRSELERFQVFKMKYMDFRKNTIAKLNAVLVRRKGLGPEEQASLIRQIEAIDDELYLFTRDLYQKSQQLKGARAAAIPEPKNILTNYALEATVTADSAITPPWQALKANEDYWVSKSLTPTHWLQVNLGQPRIIKKVFLKHSDDPDLVTRDFKFQGSNDGNQWFDLVMVKGNGARETSHDIPAAAYQYIRLEIANPSLIDNVARIQKLEIWGESYYSGS